GIADGCEDAGTALIGGETAEMPGVYDDTDYDLAGFTVGLVEKSRLITGEAITGGDAVIGLASSGIHSNGYSLVRKLVQDLDLTKTYDGLGDQRLDDVLLKPTRIYAKSVGTVMKNLPVKGISHITGGGFYENLPRMMPVGVGAELESPGGEHPPFFPLFQKLGGIGDKEMYSIFNMGIRIALVVAQEDAEAVLTILREQGETASVIGKIVSKEGVHMTS